MVPIAGSDAAKMNRAVLRALEQPGHLSVISPKAIRQALTKQHLPTSVASEPRALAEALNLNAVVTGELTKSGKQYMVTLHVHNGADGLVRGESTWAHRSRTKLIKVVERQFQEKLGAHIDSTSSPSEVLTSQPMDVSIAPQAKPDEPQPNPQPMPHPTPESTSQPGALTAVEPANIASPSTPTESAGQTAFKRRRFELNAGLSLLWRTLSYTDALSGQVPYKSGPFSVMHTSVIWYPGAHLEHGLLRYLGLAASFDCGLGMKSTDLSGAADFPTKYLAYSAGLHALIPTNRSESFSLGPQIVYGGSNFKVGDDASLQARSEIPASTYQMIAAGLVAQLRLDRVLARAQLSYLGMLDTGGFKGLYPNSSANGLRMGVNIGYAFAEHWDINAGLDYTRVGFSLKPEPGDPWIAGGALDQYVSALLNLRFFIDKAK